MEFDGYTTKVERLLQKVEMDCVKQDMTRKGISSEKARREETKYIN